MLRLTAFGDYINNSGGARVAQRFKLKLGSTTLFDTGTPVGAAQIASAARYGWRLNATILNTATNAQVCYFDLTVTVNAQGTAQGLNSLFTTGEGTVVNLSNVGTSFADVIYSAYNSAAVDTTSSQALVLSVINPTATATYDTTLKGAVVEII